MSHCFAIEFPYRFDLSFVQLGVGLPLQDFENQERSHQRLQGAVKDVYFKSIKFRKACMLLVSCGYAFEGVAQRTGINCLRDHIVPD